MTTQPLNPTKRYTMLIKYLDIHNREQVIREAYKSFREAKAIADALTPSFSGDWLYGVIYDSVTDKFQWEAKTHKYIGQLLTLKHFNYHIP